MTQDADSGTIQFTVKSMYTDLPTMHSYKLLVGNTWVLINQDSLLDAIMPSSRSFPSEGGSNSFSVCLGTSWTAVSSADWVSITAGTSGTPSEARAQGVWYTVAPNPTPVARSAEITVGEHKHTITQAARRPVLVLTSAPESQIVVIGATVSFHVSATGMGLEPNRGPRHD